MRKNISLLNPLWSLIIGYLVWVDPALAEIVPDSTLPVNSSVTPGCTTCTINGRTVSASSEFGFN
ncbi:hypothetical protein DSM106972_093770 [Dulcicalothrix desertica PCC 7102]|uniref:Filamentous haemagglutinin FhaB/tRNA nuclease CdiA-like TPS domain-containing protein n=1 Tax=Dulcicalothrix desertica PCC 7102 TaxID=232991 RepID=A0A433UKR1_9CYAN|nr:hypothetical protein [Dulcicalothrix desertica]RUS94392.1 hypothetical protein DSM106972_093770 [Dulcicalothrix desertica PCC 7102]